MSGAAATTEQRLWIRPCRAHNHGHIKPSTALLATDRWSRDDLTVRITMPVTTHRAGY